MNKTRFLTGRNQFVLWLAFFGALTGRLYAQPEPPGGFGAPPQVQASVSVALPGVEIRAESDFYEPLTSYGRWEVVGSHGRCWIPGRVEADWRPYSDGYWQRTDAGWYWVSEEPWAWATYHYGRWDLSPQFGWYWVPQIQWAPAWVSWHSGGGYIGWAPLYPSARFARGGSVEVDVRIISPRAFVFVEQRHFLEPVRRSTVVVNNTTIINKTVNITNTRIVNNTVINEGPKTQVIEQVSGRKVQEVPTRELRRKQEAPVVARQQIASPTREKQAVAAPVPSQVEKPGATPSAPAPLAPTGRVNGSEKTKPIPPQTEPSPATPRPAAIKEPPVPKASKIAPPSEQPATKFEKQAPGKPEARAPEKPVANEKKIKTSGKQGHNPKAEEQQTRPEKPAVPPPSSP